jgi:hypothetical protein
MASDRVQQLVTELEKHREATLALFKSLEAEQWQTVVYGDGDQPWTVREMLAHLASSELSMLKLFENIAEGGSGASEDFDIDRFNASRIRRTLDQTPADLITQFEKQRADTIAFVSALPDESLDLQGRHGVFGMGPMERWIKVVYEHTSDHEAHIRAALGLPDQDGA